MTAYSLLAGLAMSLLPFALQATPAEDRGAVSCEDLNWSAEVLAANPDIIAVFAAQAFGIDLSLGDVFMVMLTATLVSIGTAGIPSVSLFLAFITLEVIGVTGENAVLLIAMIFPFDRLLDMMRTATNVTGDAAVATAVAKWEGELDEEIFRRVARI